MIWIAVGTFIVSLTLFIGALVVKDNKLSDTFAEACGIFLACTVVWTVVLITSSINGVRL